MRRVSLQKITMEGGRSFVSDGEAHEGWEDVKPAVGEPYCIYCESGGILKTSNVVKMNDGYIETLNSTYKLTILEEEPFNLMEEKDSPVTQKFFFGKGSSKKS